MKNSAIDKKVNQKMDMFEKRLDNFASNIGQNQNAAGANASSVQALKSKVASLETTVESLKTELHEQKQVCQSAAMEATEQLENLEIYSRKLNLVFEGIPFVKGENCRQVIETLVRREMKIRISDFIDVAHRQYTPRNGQQPEKPIPVIVRCKTLAFKNLILNNSATLKNSGKAVHSHLPNSVMQRRSYLYQQCQAAKTVDPQAKIVKNKLHYNGKLHSMNELKHTNVGFVDSTAVRDDQIRFYGKNSYFSNFYRSSFVMRGITFSCVEQAFQYGRARMANDYYTAQQILREPNPAAMKQLGKRFKASSEEVLTQERILMEEAVRLKFQSNNDLKEKLVATFPKTILECNPYDRYYSTGLHTDDKGLDKLEFPGQNHLGRILERVRDTLRK